MRKLFHFVSEFRKMNSLQRKRFWKTLLYKLHWPRVGKPSRPIKARIEPPERDSEVIVVTKDLETGIEHRTRHTTFPPEAFEPPYSRLNR